MAATLTFGFSLSKHASFIDAGASLWVDTNRDYSISDEDRVDLARDKDNPLVWTASVKLRVDSSTNVGFVLRFSGDPDATWSLVVNSDEADKKDPVYEMRDLPVEQPFRHIMGICK